MRVLAAMLGVLAPLVTLVADAQPALGQPALHCGIPLSVSRFPSTGGFGTYVVDDGVTVATWFETRAGQGEVYCSVVDRTGQFLEGLPRYGLPLPREHGAIYGMTAERITSDRVIVGLVTVAPDGVPCANFILLRVADEGGTTSLTVSCDSSMVDWRALGFMKIVPSNEHEFLAVFANLSTGRQNTLVRRVTFDPPTPSVVSPVLYPVNVADDCLPLDAISDGRGGGYLLCDSPLPDGAPPTATSVLRIFHMDKDGAADPGWPSLGRVVAPDAVWGYPPSFVADGDGGLYLGWLRWPEATPDTLRAVVIRLDHSGELVPGWDPQGTVIVPNQESYQNELRLAVGRNQMLFATVRNVTGASVAALDGSGGIAVGWPRTGVSLAAPASPLDVDGAIPTPGADDACVVAWSMFRSLDTDGYRVFAALLPLPAGDSLVVPPYRVQLCTSVADQAVGTVLVGARPEPLAFWSDQYRIDPLNTADGLYFGPLSLGPVRALAPELKLLHQTRSGEQLHFVWRSERILDEIPQLLLGLDGSAPMPGGLVTRVDSWTVEADVAVGAACANARVELAVPGVRSEWTTVAPPLVVVCSPAQPLRIAAARYLGSGAIEVRLVSDGAMGVTTLALYDVSGRRFASSKALVAADGESVFRLAVPRVRGGIYWVQARNGALRATKPVLVVP